jgi:Flp pilus assembly pilin Flp
MRIRNGREGMEDNQKGQALVEYALTLLLVALVVILMVKAFGQSTNNMYSTVSCSVNDVFH